MCLLRCDLNILSLDFAVSLEGGGEGEGGSVVVVLSFTAIYMTLKNPFC